MIQKPSVFLSTVMKGESATTLPLVALLSSLLATIYVTVVIHRYVYVIIFGSIQVSLSINEDFQSLTYVEFTVALFVVLSFVLHSRRNKRPDGLVEDWVYDTHDASSTMFIRLSKSYRWRLSTNYNMKINKINQVNK